MRSGFRAERAPLWLVFRSLAVAIVALAAAMPAGRAQGQVIRIELEARRGNAVALGMPFQFEVKLTNQGTTSATLEEALVITPPGAAPGVTFARFVRSVPPESTITLDQSVVSAQWFAPTGDYRVSLRSNPGVAISFEVIAANQIVPRFEDVATEAGIAVAHRAPVIARYRYAAGAAWADVDADRDLDLFVPQQGAPSYLWINEGGTFVDAAADRGVDNKDAASDTFAIGLSAVFADYDNDGDPDLYVNNDGPNRLYRNDGTGHFTDVAADAGATGGDAPSSSASWGDYDNDGWLDLYVANYGRCQKNSLCDLYYEDVLLHNERDGTFTDASAALHREGSTKGAGFQAAWFDYDRDGDQDLYLGNDYVGPTPEPNVMWRNDGSGRDGQWRFTNVSTAAGMRLSMNTMGIGLGDYDRDLDIDVALSNIEAIKLMRNDGNGGFEDRARYARVQRPAVQDAEKAVTWALAFNDLNLDGWEDLFVVGGLIQEAVEYAAPQPNAVFVNGGRGRFADLSAPSGADDAGIGRGAAFADFDGDGRLDVYVLNQGEVPLLLRNTTPREGMHWLQVDTRGTMSNRDGCGTRLVARVNPDVRLLRYVDCGSAGFASGSDPTVHFGLGRIKRLSQLTVTWPSGERQVLRDLAVDRRMVVKEPAV